MTCQCHSVCSPYTYPRWSLSRFVRRTWPAHSGHKSGPYSGWPAARRPWCWPPPPDRCPCWSSHTHRPQCRNKSRHRCKPSRCRCHCHCHCHPQRKAFSWWTFYPGVRRRLAVRVRRVELRNPIGRNPSRMWESRWRRAIPYSTARKRSSRSQWWSGKRSRNWIKSRNMWKQSNLGTIDSLIEISRWKKKTEKIEKKLKLRIKSTLYLIGTVDLENRNFRVFFPIVDLVYSVKRYCLTLWPNCWPRKMTPIKRKTLPHCIFYAAQLIVHYEIGFKSPQERTFNRIRRTRILFCPTKECLQLLALWRSELAFYINFRLVNILAPYMVVFK